MKPISLFSLERHAGPYERWPRRSRLLMDGVPTPVSLPGYSMLHQFEGVGGYFFVTDWDCPFEESTHFTLVGPAFRVLSSRFVGAPYASWLLRELRVTGSDGFEAVFGEQEKWLVAIRRWGIPFVFPRIRLQRIKETTRTLSESGAVR
jgi:hypothetical protein